MDVGAAVHHAAPARHAQWLRVSTDEVRAFYSRDGNRYNCHCGQTECLLDAAGKPILTPALRKAMADELQAWAGSRA